MFDVLMNLIPYFDNHEQLTRDILYTITTTTTTTTITTIITTIITTQ